MKNNEKLDGELNDISFCLVLLVSLAVILVSDLCIIFIKLFPPAHSLLLHHSFENLRSAQVAMVHCSAQTGPDHVLQKLGQTCMVISTNTGRVYRPKDSERLILYLKDINLPKPDKWGTCQLIAFLQQVGSVEGCDCQVPDLSYWWESAVVREGKGGWVSCQYDKSVLITGDRC